MNSDTVLRKRFIQTGIRTYHSLDHLVSFVHDGNGNATLYFTCGKAEVTGDEGVRLVEFLMLAVLEKDELKRS